MGKALLLRPSEIAGLIESEPGKHCDGGNLYLQVASPGAASWVFRHKERWRSIGPADVVTIHEARDKAHAMRKAVHEGRDPFELLSDGRAAAVGATFGEWLPKYLDKKEGHWSPTNKLRERRDHERTFEAIPEFTALRIDGITEADKADALGKLGKSARRKATSWIDAVIGFAKTGVVRQRGPGDDEIAHHEAMPYTEVPALYRRLTELGTDDAKALQWTILTGARTDETIGAKHKAPATWREIETIDGLPVWVIPKTRMKGRKQHRVPLSAEALELLGPRKADDVPLFKVSSANGMLNTLKANGGNGYTVHGMRASFTEWAVAEADCPPDLADRCIAHEKRGKVQRAYQRSDLLEKRRPIMLEWSDFVTRAAPQAEASK